MNKNGTLIKRWILLILSAGMIYGIMEIGCLESTFYNSVNPLSHFPVWTLINSSVILAIILVLSAVFRRYSAAVVITDLLFLALSVVNHFMFRLHGSLLAKAELKNIATAANVIGAYQFSLDKYVILMLFLSAAVFVLAVMLHRNPAVNKMSFRASLADLLLSAAAFVLIFSGWFPFMPQIKSQGKWNLDFDSSRHGYIVCMIESLKASTGEIYKPDWYTDQFEVPQYAAAETAQEYPDVILILNETWYNLDRYVDTKADKDYMENYNALDNCIKGYAAVNGVGGGTNGSEYELLTSNSLTLISSGSPFQDLSMVRQHSIVDYLESLGYHTLAAHPATASNYHRHAGWSGLGFDELYFDSSFVPIEAYGERNFDLDTHSFSIFANYVNHMEASAPRLGYLLTIQNHGGWDMNPEDAAIVHVPENNPAFGSVSASTVSEYLSCMYLTDQAISRLKEEFENLYSETGRKVVVCMVGDHCPSFMPSMNSGLDEKEKTLAHHTTPYFIWANFPIETDYPNTDVVDLCDLVPLTLRTAGIPLSAYHSAVLDMLDSGVSVHTDIYRGYNGLESQTYMTDDGEVHDIREETELSEKVRLYYSMEYNNAVNNSKVRDDLFLAGE